jgi:hypothetical protein
MRRERNSINWVIEPLKNWPPSSKFVSLVVPLLRVITSFIIRYKESIKSGQEDK